MKLKPSLTNSNKGFTLVELLVTTVMASLVLGFSLSLITDQRQQFVNNQARSEANQTLRAGMDLMGADIQATGNHLQSAPGLPVISVINGASGAPDQLVLQRKMIADTLTLCANLSGSSTELVVSKRTLASGETGCPSFSDGNANNLTDSLDAFRDYRCGIDGAAACTARSSPPSTSSCTDECVWAYIHDPVNNRGEFFLYGFEASTDSNTLNKIYKGNPGNWQYSYTYTAGSSTNPVIYILEEQRYGLNGNVLELVTNRQQSLTVPLVNKIQNLQLSLSRATDPDNNPATPPVYVTDTAFNSIFTETPSATYVKYNQTGAPNAASTDWKTIQHIQVDLTSANVADSDAITLKQCGTNNQCFLSSRFFPRNILSIQP
ncbi:MAG: prepilin-type N-terminal cleavage/methylation domain-containing protein [Acaryochloridaceae cyanobacterium SU_2_1]|nr:prepilin-type N-terminal cleavage/methylation domain-containing protein [Acaryochloridaceae cyanobacterium SU_2_1]